MQKVIKTGKPEDQKIKNDIQRLQKSKKTVKQITKILKISNKTYYRIMKDKNLKESEEDDKKETIQKETPKEELKKTTANKITYEPEEMSLIMQSYAEATKLQFSNLEEYLTWRTKIIPFLASKPQEGREFLYNLSFITVMTSGSKESQLMTRTILKNILDMEMTERIKEIEQTRKPKQ